MTTADSLDDQEPRGEVGGGDGGLHRTPVLMASTSRPSICNPRSFVQLPWVRRSILLDSAFWLLITPSTEESKLRTTGPNTDAIPLLTISSAVLGAEDDSNGPQDPPDPTDRSASLCEIGNFSSSSSCASFRDEEFPVLETADLNLPSSCSLVSIVIGHHHSQNFLPVTTTFSNGH